jgi:hypothetical protein
MATSAASKQHGPRFSTATIDYFTQGLCHELALEINRRTDWPLWACIEDDGFERRGVHALVRLPDGRFLDVRGLQDKDEVRSHWKRPQLRRVSAGYFKDWWHYEEINRARVRRTAARLLAHVEFAQ